MLRSSLGSCLLRAALVSSLAVLGACSDDDGGGSTTGGGGGSAPSTTSGSSSSGTNPPSATSSTSGSSGGSTGDGGSGSGGDGAGGDAGGGGGDAVGGGSSAGPPPVVLGTAGNFVILAKSRIANDPISAITGDLGLSPAAASYITGLSMTRDGQRWTSSQVTGSIFAADNDPPTPTMLTTAVSDMETAYTDAAGRPDPDFLAVGDGAIGGLTLAPGLYRWSSVVTIADDLVLEGDAGDVWLFQISGDLDMAAAAAITLTGGARAADVFWQVAGAVTLAPGAHAEGIILAQTSITLQTGASIDGRLLAQTAVDVAASTVVGP